MTLEVYLKLDADVLDRSPKKNSIASTNISYSSGKVNNGAVFNNSEVSIPDLGFDLRSNFSIAFWVKFTSLSSTMVLFDNGLENKGFGIKYDSVDDKLYASVMDDNSIETKLALVSSPSVNMWYHIVVTWDMSTKTLNGYVDSANVGNVVPSGVFSTNISQNMILGRNASGLLPLYGIIDDFRFFSDVISTLVVIQLYYYNPTYEVEVNGVDVSLEDFDGDIELNITFKRSVCTLKLVDTYGYLTSNILYGHELYVFSSQNKVFGGIVDSYEVLEDGTVSISAIDFSYFLDEEPIVYSATNKTASQIVSELVSTYAPTITTDIDSTLIQYTHTWYTSTPYEIMLMLAIAEDFNVWITPDKVLKFKPKTYLDSGILVDEDNMLTSNFPTLGDNFYNYVHIIGAGSVPGRDSIYVRLRDSQSISKYGVVRHKIIEKSDLKTLDEAISFGRGFLRLSANPLLVGKFSIFTNFNIKPGEIIRITASVVGWTDTQALVLSVKHNVSGTSEIEVVNYNVEMIDAINNLIDKRRENERKFVDRAAVPSLVEVIEEQVKISLLLTVEMQNNRRGWNQGSPTYRVPWTPNPAIWNTLISGITEMITDLGLNKIRDLINGKNVVPLDAANSNIALGTGTTSPTANDTALEAETVRKAVDAGFPRDVGVGTTEYQVSITDNEVAVDTTFTEFGLLDAASNGTLVARSAVSPGALKRAGEVLRVRMQIGVARA